MIDTSVAVLLTDHAPDASRVGGVNLAGLTQLTFTLLCFLGQNVVHARVIPLEPARTGDPEALAGASVCFQFRHCLFLDGL
jgi:hypothetical protein